MPLLKQGTNNITNELLIYTLPLALVRGYLKIVLFSKKLYFFFFKKVQYATCKSIYPSCMEHKISRTIFTFKFTKKKVWKHIKKNAEEKGIHIDFINGYHDHCHCLVALQSEQTLSQIMQLIKGESSFWINKNKLCKDHFSGKTIIMRYRLVNQPYRTSAITLKIRNFTIKRNHSRKKKIN